MSSGTHPPGDPPGIAAIRAAATRIAGSVRRPPLLEDEAINARRRPPRPDEGPSASRVTGSFKARGAWNAVASLVHGDAHGMRMGRASDVHRTRAPSGA